MVPSAFFIGMNDGPMTEVTGPSNSLCQHSFAPAGMASESITRFSFSSPFSL